jgi:ribosome recycling factor
MDKIIAETEGTMKKAIESMKQDLLGIRTGRANPGILDVVKVDSYGSKMPLKQLANISSPDKRLLIIQPWDRNLIKEIEKSIVKADLGITPIIDGAVIRLPIPQLTEERRKQLVKTVKKRGEDAKVALRNIRRDTIEKLKKTEKSGDISEDDLKRGQEKIQKLIDKYTEETDKLVDGKTHEIMEI